MVFFGLKDAKDNTAAAGSKHREEEEEEMVCWVYMQGPDMEKRQRFVFLS